MIDLKFILICYLFKSVHSQASQRCYVPARGAIKTVSNGERVPDRYYPWHVSVNKKRTGRLSEYMCGGSIISKKFILTAAHCLYEENQEIIEERLFIRAGSNRMEGGTYYEIHKTIIHKDYNSANWHSDIALLKTSNVIPFTRIVRPVCYTKTDFIYANKEAWIPGWGLSENQASGRSEYLHHANMPGRTGDDCDVQNSDFYKKYANDNNFCAGNSDSTSICSGDSGGGLVMKRSDGWYIRGIASLAATATSGTFSACDLTKYALFTDVAKFADWIDDNLITSQESRKLSECDQYLKDHPVVHNRKWGVIFNPACLMSAL